MTEQGYDLSTEAAEFYESTFVPALFGDWARRLVDFAAVATGESVLDVACGTGVVARTAARRVGNGGAVMGVDVNEAMLEVARRREPGVRWIQGDAADLPFDDDSFDLVLCQAALMFFADRAAALREMGRVAGADGRVAIQVAGAPCPQRRLRRPHRCRGPARRTGGARPAGVVLRRRRTGAAAGHRRQRRSRRHPVRDVDRRHPATLAGAVSRRGAAAIAEKVEPTTRARILADAGRALASFVDGDGAIAAPIEVHLVAMRRRGT